MAFFHARPYFREDLIQALPKLEDATRIVQRFSLNRGDTNDLLAIKTTTIAWANLRKRVEQERAMEEREREDFNAENWTTLELLLSRLESLEGLASRIDSSLQSNVEGSAGSIGPDTEEPEEEPATSLKSWRYLTNKWTIKPE